MANWKIYAVVGDNGYGMTDEWRQAAAFLDYLSNGWPKGFNNEEEAYKYICDQCKLKWSLRNEICSLDTLRQKKFILTDKPEPEMDVIPDSQKPVMKTSSTNTLRKLLEEDGDIPNIPLSCGRPRNYKNELVKAFDAWLTDLTQRLETKP